MTTTTEASTEAAERVRANAQTVLGLAFQHANGLSLVHVNAGSFDGEVSFRTNEDAEAFAARIGAELDDNQNAHHAKANTPFRSWVTPDGTVRVSGWGQ